MKKTFVYKVNKGEIKVGDYVTYTPDELDSNAVATLKSNLNTY